MKTGKTLEIKIKDPCFNHVPSPYFNHAASATANWYPTINTKHIPNIINNIGEVSNDDVETRFETSNAPLMEAYKKPVKYIVCPQCNYEIILNLTR